MDSKRRPHGYSIKALTMIFCIADEDKYNFWLHKLDKLLVSVPLSPQEKVIEKWKTCS